MASAGWARRSPRQGLVAVPTCAPSVLHLRSGACSPPCFASLMPAQGRGLQVATLDWQDICGAW